MKKIFLILAFLAFIFSAQAQKIFYTDVHIYGKTGIGGVPLTGLHLMGDNSIYAQGLFQFASSSDSSGILSFYRSRGTLSGLVNSNDGDTIYSLYFKNYETGWKTSAYLGVQYHKNVFGGRGGEYYIYTRDLTSNLLKNRFLIEYSNGNTQILNSNLYLIQTPNFATTDTSAYKGLFRNSATGEVTQRGISASLFGGWALLGNAGTVDGTNFIGTTDNVPLDFRVNNVLSGRIDNTKENTFFGYSSGIAVTSGVRNTFIGASAGISDTSGSRNTIIGRYAGAVLKSGTDNVFLGNDAGGQSLSNYNTFLGVSSGYNNSTGINNIGLGYYSGKYTDLDRRLFINSLDRTNVAGDTTQSIIYARQHATASTQSLYLNSQVYLPYLTNVGSSVDSVLVIDGATNRLEFVAQGSIFDSAAFLAACHPVLRYSQWDACSPATINADSIYGTVANGLRFKASQTDSALIQLDNTGIHLTNDNGVFGHGIINMDVNSNQFSNRIGKYYNEITQSATGTNIFCGNLPLRNLKTKYISSSIQTNILLDTASITSTATGVLNSTIIKQDTSIYAIIIKSDTSIKVNPSGSVRFNEAYTFPVADGALNEVLKTDGAGNVSWGTGGGGGADTSYAHILIHRPNELDTLIPATAIDLVANTTLFPKGSYFHFYKGSYISTVNLARDSCVYYFDKGAIVSTNTEGTIFDFTTIALTSQNPINILGYGSFFYNVGNNDENGFFKIASYAARMNINIEFDVAGITEIQNKGSTIDIRNYDNVTNNKKVNIKGNEIYTLGYCYPSNNGNAIRIESYYLSYLASTMPTNIEVKKIHSTSGSALFIYANINVTVTSDDIHTDGAGWYQPDDKALTIKYASAVCSITNCGSTYINNNYGGDVVLYGGYNTIENHGSNFTSLYGDCGTLTSDGYFQGGYVRTINISGGYADVRMLSVSANYTDRTSFQCSAGTLKLNGQAFDLHNSGYAPHSSISGTGKVIMNGCDIKLFGDNYCSDAYGYTDGFINLSGSGLLELRNCHMEILNSGVPICKNYVPAIQKTGASTLILSSCSFHKFSPYQEFINCPTTRDSIMIYTGGVTTNGITGDLLSAKARKDSLIVSSVAITSITLNDGSGGDETFTETDIITYNTVELMAARMVALINASGTLAITAVYTTGASFTTEADVAGTNYADPSSTNLYAIKLRMNSKAIIDITGGAIIENPNVIY